MATKIGLWVAIKVDDEQNVDSIYGPINGECPHTWQ